MFAPGARNGHLSPQSIAPFVLVVLGVLLLVAAWLALVTGVTVTGSLSGGHTSVVPSPLSSVAYLVPEADADVIYIRGTGSNDIPHEVVSFPRVLSLKARGLGSPNGDRLAVLHLADGPGKPARLSLVSLPGGDVTTIGGEFDYLSGLAWSPSGARIAAARTEPGAQMTGHILHMVEIDTATAAARDVATFENAQQAVPVGYSPDGQRLYIAVIDQSGSTLWMTSAQGAERVAVMSDGPTRDWSLSPDGQRVAFIDRMGVGERRFVARVLFIQTRKVQAAPLEGDQLGTAWRPDSHLVDFGGPGGSLWFGAPKAGEEYVIPQQWSPDASLLAATVYVPRQDGGGEPSEYVEILSEGSRLRLTDVPGARFLGFVREQ